jgi:hypothetical protein
MTVADSIKAQLDEAEFVIREQMARIEDLTAEVERLKAGLDAHGTLQQIYRNPDTAESNRIKAANAAIGFEKGKVLSMSSPINLDRRERWRVYEMWAQRREYIFEHRTIPPRGWNDHLQRDNYVEPPESEGMPPVDVIEDPISGFKILSNLLPKPGQRRIGNGGGDGSGSND